MSTATIETNPFADEMPVQQQPITPGLHCEIAEYSPVASALASLRTRFAGNIYEVTTETGMWAAKEARKEIAAYRIQLEKQRKAIKDPALKRCQLIDSEAKILSNQIAALEDPIARQIQTEENRIEHERIEEQEREAGRVAGIQNAIEELRRLPITLANATSHEIDAKRDALAATRSDTTGAWLVQFQEYFQVAETARDATIIALHELWHQRANAEKHERQLAADLAELEQLRAARAADIALDQQEEQDLGAMWTDDGTASDQSDVSDPSDADVDSRMRHFATALTSYREAAPGQPAALAFSAVCKLHAVALGIIAQ